MFRKATLEDLSSIAQIYDAIHTAEEAGLATCCWVRSIYPTEATARMAIAQGDMFVMEEDGMIVACARINHEQVDCYKEGPWVYDVPPEQVMVLHTLVVHPAHGKKGYGKAFLRFYEEYALAHRCPYLRLDTNARNTNAREFYRKLGYREIGAVPCTFNGIPGVSLILLEKKL